MTNIFVQSTGKVLRGNFRRSIPAPKDAGQKRLDILEFCRYKERQTDDIARCCGHISGRLTSASRAVIYKLVTEGLLSKSERPIKFRATKGQNAGYQRKGYRCFYKTTEAGIKVIDPNSEGTLDDEVLLCWCGKKTITEKQICCKKCFDQLEPDERQSVIQEMLQRSLKYKGSQSTTPRINPGACDPS